MGIETTIASQVVLVLARRIQFSDWMGIETLSVEQISRAFPVASSSQTGWGLKLPQGVDRVHERRRRIQFSDWMGIETSRRSATT